MIHRVTEERDSQDDDDQLSKDIKLDYQQFDPYEEELNQQDEEFRKEIKSINPTYLLESYSETGLPISSLSINQYKNILKTNKNLLLGAVPQLPKLGATFQNGNGFLSFRQLSEMSLAACNTVQESFYESRLRWRTYHKKLFYDDNEEKLSRQPSSLHQSSSIISDQSKYQSLLISHENDTLLSLRHNKQQLMQIVLKNREKNHELIKAQIDEKSRQLELIKEQKVKVYPSKLIDEQKRQMLAKQFIPLQLEGCRPTQMTAKSRQLTELLKVSISIIADWTMTRVYDLYYYNHDQFHTKPEMRESSSLIALKDKLYLYGGVGMHTFNSFWVMDVDTFQWKKIDQAVNPYGTLSRNAHSMCLFKKLLVIFGGEKKSTSEAGRRDLLCDVKLFNIELKTWQQQPPQQSYVISPRKNQTAIVVGKFMLVFAGIDQKSRFLDDVWVYDLTNFKWSLAELDHTFTPYPQGVAYHQAVGLYHPLKKYNYLYRSEELKQDKVDKRSPYQQEGMIVFGGLDQKDELIDNKVYMLKTDIRPMVWVAVQTKGVSPSSRFGHTMNFIERLGVIVVYGGRNHEVFLGDAHILRCDSFNWQNVVIHNNLEINRSFHNATHIDTKLYIFGGYGENGFVSSDVQVLELDQQVAKQHARRIQIQEPVVVTLTKAERQQEKIDKQNKEKKELIQQLQFKKLPTIAPKTGETKNFLLQEKFKNETEHFVAHELDELSKEQKQVFRGRRDGKYASVLFNKRQDSIIIKESN